MTFIVLRTLSRQAKIYAIYIGDTQSAQILQKMATWAHDVYDVHEASSLF